MKIEDEGTGWGDKIASALGRVGITPDRVTALLGVPCGCEARKEKLNQLGAWATMVLRGKVPRAMEFFERIESGWK